MANSNGIIRPPIGISDLKTVLGSQSPYLGVLCINSDINKFARFKPVRYPQKKPLTEANRRAVAHGIVFPDIVESSTITGAAIQDAAANDWDYEQPTGSSASPYRITDFVNAQSPNSAGYYNDAVPPIQVVYPRDGWVFSRGSAQRSLVIAVDLDPDDSAINLQAEDFVSAGLDLNDWKLIAYLDTTHLTTKIFDSDDTILNGGEISGNTIVVPFPGGTGTYNIDVYICMYRFNNSTGKYEFLPLPKQGDYNPSVFTLKVIDDAEASGGGVPGADTEEMFNNVAFAPMLNGGLDPETHTFVYKTAWECTDNGTAKWSMKSQGSLYVMMNLRNTNANTSTIDRADFELDLNGTGAVTPTTMYDADKRVISSVQIPSGDTVTIYMFFDAIFNRIGIDWTNSNKNSSWSMDFTRNGATLFGGDIYAQYAGDGWEKRST